jgi:TRAP-type mannitol/chloroaromatic compound transport system permease large subunit
VTTADIYRGVLPFILLQATGVLLVWLLPALATRLPALLF